MKNVSAGFNLYIDINTACNSSCPFCIAPTIGRHNADTFFSGLDYALGFTETHGGSVQVVGGEPMISRRFPEVMNKIYGHSFHRVVVNTNGTFMDDNRIGQMHIGGVSHINISRHHYNSRLNQEIMQNRPFLSNTDLRETIGKLLGDRFNVRLNCNIIKDYIHSLPEMETFVEWAADQGITVVSFSQVYPLGLFDHQVPPVPGYTESVQVDLEQLVTEIDRKYSSVPHKEFEERIGKVLDGWGSTWYMPSLPDSPTGKRRYWKLENTIFSVKTLAGYDTETGLPLDTQYDKYDDQELRDTIDFAVLHPDGLVAASWDRRERIIFDPTKPETILGARVDLSNYIVV